MKANPVVDRGEYNPSGTYWRKVAEVLKRQLAVEVLKKRLEQKRRKLST